LDLAAWPPARTTHELLPFEIGSLYHLGVRTSWLNATELDLWSKSMKFLTLLAATLTVVALPLLMNAARANDYTLGTLEISQPWARATPKGAETGAGYLTIKNTGSEPDRLVSATLSNATTVELHQMTMDNGVMKMREVADGIQIKPGETVALRPNGYHIMLRGLKEPLVNGQTVAGSLTFERAGTIKVEFQVAPAGSLSPQGQSQMQNDHMQMDHMH
jgi:periplasmic copper chaperone A